MADDKAKTVEEIVDEEMAKSEAVEESEVAAEQKVEPEAEPKEKELSDEEKHSIQIQEIREELKKAREEKIRSDAEKELLKAQLESEVLSKIKEPKEVVVDDGFKALTDEEQDELSPSKLRQYLKDEMAHEKRLEEAKAETETKHRESINPSRVQAEADIRSLQSNPDTMETFNIVRPIMGMMVQKDEMEGNCKRILDYYEPAIKVAKSMGWIKEETKEAPKGIPGDVPPVPVPKKGIAVVSEKPNQPSSTAPTGNMTINEALDAFAPK